MPQGLVFKASPQTMSKTREREREREKERERESKEKEKRRREIDTIEENISFHTSGFAPDVRLLPPAKVLARNDALRGHDKDDAVDTEV